MNWYLISLFLLCLISLSAEDVVLRPALRFEPAAEQYLGEVTEKYHLSCFGGGGSTGYGLYSLVYSFNAPAVETPEEAVEIYVAVVSAMKAGLENARSLRPFFFAFPVKPENLSVIIYFNDPHTNRWVSDGQKPGMVKYSNREKKIVVSAFVDNFGNEKPLYSTPYRTNSVALTKPVIDRPLKQVDFSETSPKWCMDFEVFLEKSGAAIAQANGIQYRNVMLAFYFKRLPDTFSPWGWNLSGRQELNVEEGRGLALRVVDGLWNTISTAPEFASYLKDEYKYYAQHYGPDSSWIRAKPTIKNIAFRINFWDENYDRKKPPHLAQIMVEEGKIYYYFADPKTQELQKPVVETLEEARSQGSVAPL